MANENSKSVPLGVLGMEGSRRVLGQREQKANFIYFIIWLRLGFDHVLFVACSPQKKKFLTHDSAVLYEGSAVF